MKLDMKAENTHFNPIHINLVIESKEELVELVMRLNMAPCQVKDTYGQPYKKELWDKRQRAFSSLWNELDNICREFGLRNN